MGYVNYDKLGYDVDFVNINIGQDVIDEMDHKKVLKVTTDTFRKYAGELHGPKTRKREF